jgi:hypothetical protein
MDGDQQLDVVAQAQREKAINNFTEGHLMNYFKRLSDLIEIGKPHNERSQPLTTEGKKILKANTLYVPDYLRKKLDRNTHEFEVLNDAQMKQLFAAYKGKYEIVPEETIGQKIANGEDFYYLRYCYDSPTRYFDIVHSTTGEAIMKEQGRMHNNLIPVDFVVMWE